MWLTYHNEPGVYRIPEIPHLDYEVGQVRPGVPFQVPDDVGAWLTGPKGNSRLRVVEGPAPSAPDEIPLPPPLVEDDPGPGPAAYAGSSVSGPIIVSRRGRRTKTIRGGSSK